MHYELQEVPVLENGSNPCDNPDFGNAQDLPGNPGMSDGTSSGPQAHAFAVHYLPVPCKCTSPYAEKVQARPPFKYTEKCNAYTLSVFHLSFQASTILRMEVNLPVWGLHSGVCLHEDRPYAHFH